MEKPTMVPSKRIFYISLGLIPFFFAFSPLLKAQTYDHGSIFSVVEENDLVVNTDRHYTQGIKLSYLHADSFLPGWSSNLYDCLPDIGFTKKVGKFGYEIGQNIFTPSDLNETELL